MSFSTKALQALGWLVTGFILSSCVRASLQPLVSPMPPSLPESCPLAIYLSGTTELPGVTKVCKVTATEPDVPWRRTDPKSVIERAFKQACSCGAQGVLVDDYTGTSVEIIGFRFGSNATQPPDAITLGHFQTLMSCRYRRGIWNAGKCTILPPASARGRVNMRD